MAELNTTTQTPQELLVSGKITDEKGEALPGVSILIKGTSRGTTSGSRGEYQLAVPDANAVLIFSFVGYTAKEVSVGSSATLNVSLAADNKSLNEVIVTGVFDKRKRMEASVGITTLSASQIQGLQPNSAADLLKNVPGVYVNSAQGEIRNTVYSRGVGAGSEGYFYVSMQEDGLPVSNVSGISLGPDYFLRADATINRLEAVRGGSAAITGPNAPGGIFNYVSKTGGGVLAGEVRTKYGLEGNANPYYRADLSLGGKLNKKGDLTFHIGGFYRYNNGVRYAGYPLNFGGQLKANVVKTYAKGSLKLYGKFLNDHNSYLDFLPAQNFDKPGTAPGIINTDTFAGPGNQVFDYKYSQADPVRHFDPKNLIHAQDRAIGLDWQHDLGNGWSVSNNGKYTSKTLSWNSVLPLGILSGNELLTYYFMQSLGRFGTYNFTDLTTGQPALTTMQLPKLGPKNEFLGFDFPVIKGQLPNAVIQPYPVLVQLARSNDNNLNEFLDQFTVNKRVGKMNFTAGLYYGASHMIYQENVAGLGLSTAENRPHPLGISITDFAGTTYQATNPQGLLNTGGSFKSSDYQQNQLALFFGHSWQITDKLNLDYGFRYDHTRVKGSSLGSITDSSASAGGYDKNPLTLWDNAVNKASAPWFTDNTINTFSFSGALNYQFSSNLALYGRFSQGNKTPDLTLYTSSFSQDQVDKQMLDPQHISQIEVGLKVKQDKFTGFITPFYSRLSNLASNAYVADKNNQYYYTPNVYSSRQSYGLELEGTYSLTRQLSIRAVATVQRTRSILSRSWVTGDPGPQDDRVVEVIGGRISGTPDFMTTITPTYTAGKFNAFVNFYYLGKRAANNLETFYLPGFGQTDLGLGYRLTKRLTLNGNVNNLFNTVGVMDWQAPGGFPNSGNTGGFTPAQREANPNAIFSILPIQPRSFYLSASYRF
ncbi:TonB-dependent receptor [Spirosoma aerophilum]